MKKKSIGVVGGGFAGLTLALALQRHSSDTAITVTLLEARSQSMMMSRMNGGSIRLHNGASLLKLIFGPDDLQCRKLTRIWSKENGLLSRQMLLESLIRSLRPGTVCYDERVVSLGHSTTGKCCLEIIADHAEKGTLRYDFDALVLADGLTSVTRAMVRQGTERYIALVGDAGVQFGREPCFGASRICYGASDAFKSSIELAKILVMHEEIHFGHFAATHWFLNRASGDIILGSSCWVLVCILCVQSAILSIKSACRCWVVGSVTFAAVRWAAHVFRD